MVFRTMNKKTLKQCEHSDRAGVTSNTEQAKEKQNQASGRSLAVGCFYQPSG